IDTEVRRLLDESRARVSATLTARRATLDVLAGVLLEKEVVDRHMLDELLRAAAPGPATDASAPTVAA
ncbi:MAG: cell division protein FtsH, partial [Rhodoferax sp.]|nr:cell division protein FtsH [Rhodoferax sp.]